MSTPSQKWHPDVSPISVEDLDRLGINAKHQLFWDGHRVETRQSLSLTGFQKIFTGVVTLCAVLGAIGGFVSGVNNASIFLCARNVHWLTCP